MSERTLSHRKASIVPTHCETVPGEARMLRWIVPAGTFTTAGRVADAPGDVGVLLAGPDLRSLTVEPGGESILAAVTDPGCWARLGGRLQRALAEALTDPHSWTITAQAGIPDNADHLIWAAADDILAGQLGSYIHSHGGDIELVDVTGGIVTVRFHGACRECPISTLTLHTRFEHGLRVRCPELVAVRVADTRPRIGRHSRSTATAQGRPLSSRIDGSVVEEPVG